MLFCITETRAQNYFAGMGAGNLTLTGIDNTGVGPNSSPALTSGNANTGFGDNTLNVNQTGTGNVAIGAGVLALYNNANGFNTAVGTNALAANVSGQNMCAFGRKALTAALDGPNDAFGWEALQALTGATGINNAAFGYEALTGATGAAGTSAFGNTAGSLRALYTNCTFVGYGADATASGNSNSMALGYNALVAGGSSIQIGNGSIGTITTQVDLTVTSDKRFKYNITENDVKGLEFIKRLRPVVYNFDSRKYEEFVTKNIPDSVRQRYLSDDFKPSSSIRRSGFIAQEVELAAKESGYNFSGVHIPANDNEVYGLAYASFVVPLVKAAQEEDAVITAQANTIKTLNETVVQQQEVLASVLSKMETLANQLQDIKECCNNNTGGSSTPTHSNNAQLFNAVPNPSPGSSAIYYFVPSTAKSAKIQISGVNGTVLQTVSISNFGYSSMAIQTGNLSGDTYLYSLIVDDQLIDTRKLNVVLK